MSVVISSQVVLTGSLGGIALSHPRILWDDIWRASTAIITASTEVAGSEGANVADGFTWDFWTPTSLPATLELQCAAAEVVDYVLIAAHSIGSNECRVKAQYHNGTSWLDMTAEVAPGTDRVLAFLFDPVTASRFRLYVDGDNSPEQLPSIGIVMMGQALAMQRGVTLNHRPITMARKTVARPQISEGGQTLGRSIKRQGVASEIAFEHLEASWIRTHFEPFMESARVYPFGWVWHPTSYPAEVALLWLPAGKEDIKPEHAGLPNRMNVSFMVEGIVE